MIKLLSAWRKDFPAITALAAQGQTYLDSAATTQKPQCMLDALLGYYQNGAANVHRAQHLPGEVATRAFEDSRAVASHWLNAEGLGEVIFTRGTTESINLLAYALKVKWQAGDEIAISAAEHHANLLPWQQLAQRHQLRLTILPLTRAGDIDLEQARLLIGPRTRLVAVSALSNVLGRRQHLTPLLQHAKAQGALTLIDGAQAAVHQRPEVAALDCDFYVCSAHKLYGPEGVGLLFVHQRALSQLQHWQFGGEMVQDTDYQQARFRPAPLGFEAGTPAIGAVIAFAASLRYLLSLDPYAVAQHEAALHQQLGDGLKQRQGLHLLGEPTEALVSFYVEHVHSADLAQLLTEQGICLRSGSHCAMPLMQQLGVDGALRASLALYNDSHDIERLLNALDRALEILQ